MDVQIDGVDYVPRCEIDAVTDAKAADLCRLILGSLFLYGTMHGKQLRNTLLEALEALSPDLYDLARNDISAALSRVDPEHNAA